MSDSVAFHANRIMFPLAAEYLLYGLYVALFGTGIFVLRQRKRPEYRIHLISMCFLFSLGSLSIILDSVNRGLSFSIALNPTFLERLDNHDSGAERLATNELVLNAVILMIYAIANVVADLLLIYRLYAIWDMKKNVILLPSFVSICNCIYALVALSYWVTLPEKLFTLSSTHLKVVSVVYLIINALVNTAVTGLIAGRIWWIARQAQVILGTQTQQRYKTVVAILLESGICYPVALIVCSVSLFELFPLTLYPLLTQIVGIVPTLIVVRAGLGVAIENVNDTVISQQQGKSNEPRFNDSPTVTQISLPLPAAEFELQEAQYNYSYSLSYSSSEATHSSRYQPPRSVHHPKRERESRNGPRSSRSSIR